MFDGINAETEQYILDVLGYLPEVEGTDEQVRLLNEYVMEQQQIANKLIRDKQCKIELLSVVVRTACLREDTSY